MDDRNSGIWRAGAFQTNCHRPRLICGRRRFEWRCITALVQRIMLYKKRLVIVVAAAGSDPNNPTEHDLTNAQISALVISRQRRFCRNRRLGVYLEYRGPVLREVRLNLPEIARRVGNGLANGQTVDPNGDQTPSPIISFLLQLRDS